MKEPYCPIKGVSMDCEGCNQEGWEMCVYVKLWEERKQGKPLVTKPYRPLNEG